MGSATACSAANSAGETAEPIPLLPYSTLTPTVFQPTATGELQPTLAPLPSPTPLLYTVVANDTLIGIAVKFNVTLEALLTANPGVDPRFLSVGKVLFIPIGEAQIASAIPSPTPVSLEGPDPVCYLTSSGGTWCFWLVTNTHAQALENLSAQINLYSQNGELLASQTALTPLNLIPAGSQAPLSAYFPPPSPDWNFARAHLLTAVTVSDEGTRYLPLQMEGLDVDIAVNGLQATARGQVRLASGSMPASLVWIVAVAYDAAGNVVGVRRWESSEALAPGSAQNFVVEVFSLGPPIDHVDILTEARP